MFNKLILARVLNIFEISEIFEVRSEANTEIQSSNMFRSWILSIWKVQIRSNIKCFEFFDNLKSNISNSTLTVCTPFHDHIYMSVHLEVGCPKYSKHLIFDLIWTFRILRIRDLNIFELWISVFNLIWSELRIFRISRIYSSPWLRLIFEWNWDKLAVLISW